MSSRQTQRIELESSYPDYRRFQDEETLAFDDEKPMLQGQETHTSSSHVKAYFNEEPVSHVKNKSLLVRLCAPCWPDNKNRLTRKELKSYNNLREEATIKIDPKCEDFDHLLRELFDVLTEETLEEIPNEKWKEFGFQNSNPRSDFRAGGVVALKQLTSFAKNYGKRIKFMVSPTNEFFLAISSIYITHFLEIYYHISSDEAPQKNRKELCSRIALKSFCRILNKDKEAWDQIHQMLLNDLYDTWQRIRKTVPGVTLLDFGMAQELVKKKFKMATKGYNFTSFEQLRQVYEKTTIAEPTKRPSLTALDH